jgi:hypothetical protein
MSLNHLQGFLPQCPPSLPNLLDLGASHHGQMKCAPLGWVAPSLQIHPMTTQHSMKPPPDLLPRIRLKPKIMTGSLTWGRGPQVHLPPPAMHAAREVGLYAAKSSEPGSAPTHHPNLATRRHPHGKGRWHQRLGKAKGSSALAAVGSSPSRPMERCMGKIPRERAIRC